jgi:HK97 family phage major capsid protein
MRDVVPVIPLDSTNAVEYVRESWTTPTADYQVAEGDKKAQTGVTYTEFTANVRTIANFVKVSRQMAQDVPFIMATIEQRLANFVLLKEDKEILYGDNSAGHLYGIMPQAIKLATFWTPPGTGNTFTSVDELNIAATHIENNYYFPNAIILNPTDEAKIEMMKTTYGAYVLGDRSPREDGLLRVWGLPVITTPNITVGDFLVGAFNDGCALFDRETVTVEIAFQNEDDFVRNLITVRAEERVAFAVFVPQAFVCGPFSCPPCAGGGPFAVAENNSGAAQEPKPEAHHTKK